MKISSNGAVIFDLKTLARTMSQQCTLIGQAEVNEVSSMGCMGRMGICAAGPESWSRWWTVNDCTMREFCDGRKIDSWRTCSEMIMIWKVWELTARWDRGDTLSLCLGLVLTTSVGSMPKRLRKDFEGRWRLCCPFGCLETSTFPEKGGHPPRKNRNRIQPALPKLDYDWPQWTDWDWCWPATNAIFHGFASGM